MSIAFGSINSGLYRKPLFGNHYQVKELEYKPYPNDTFEKVCTGAMKLSRQNDNMPVAFTFKGFRWITIPETLSEKNNIKQIPKNKLDPETLKAVDALQAKPGDILFKTEKGSIYKIEGKGTIRYKAELIARQHGEEAGLREKYSTPIFVDEQGVNEIFDKFYDRKDKPRALWPVKVNDKTLGGIFVVSKDGKSWELESQFDFSKQPSIGLTPVEISYDKDKQFKYLHLGHKIVDIFTIE